MLRFSYLLVAILMAHFPASTHAHGRMLIPGSRQSGFLKGLDMPANYQDHEMNCGGRDVQWNQNGGKCGICGDPWSGPRLYERPDGIMVQHNIITEHYLENQVIIIQLQITAHHGGSHQFSICNIAESGGVEANQECLERTILRDEHNASKFTNGTQSNGFFVYQLVLPPGFTCNHCVLQWKWKCGNDWGCANGWCCTGCGDRQEEFYACADVSISPRNGRVTIPPSLGTTPTATTTWRYPSTKSSTKHQPATYPTYHSTWPQWRTTPPSTQVHTTKSTTTTRAPTIIHRPSSTSSYNYNVIYNYFKNNPRNGSHNTSVKFPDRRDSNYSPNGNSKSADEHFLNMVLGRSSSIVFKDGFSVPNHSSDSSTAPTPDEYGTLIESDYLVKDRYCAACFYGCRYNLCFNYCSDVCKRGPSTRQLG